MQGKYSTVVMSGQKKITIGKDFIEDKKGKKSLSKSLVLIHSKGKYVVNIKKEAFGKKNAGWNSYVIEEAGCGFLRVSMLAIPDETNQNEATKKNLDLFKAIYSPQIDSNKRYLLSINDKQFWKLMADTNYTLTVVLDKIK